MLNRKSGKLLSIWWFFMLGIIGLSIVIGTIIFYSAEADVRELEATILSDSISNCIISQGYLIEEFFSEDFNVIEKCSFAEEKIVSEKFYFKIIVLDKNKENELKEIHNGIASFEGDCKIVLSGEVKGKNLPKCIEKEKEIILSENGQRKNAVLYILTASNKKGKKG